MSTHLTAERLGEYLELYFEDADSFREYVSDDLERIRRRDEAGIEADLTERLGERERGRERDRGPSTDAGSSGGGGGE
jgi:hypothetical protein